jgi:two-component system, NtrC family, response regulator AtoC
LNHYIKVFSEENKVPPLTVEPGALRYLQSYPWPGNVRELRNFAENAVVLHRGGKLTEYELEPKFRGEATWSAPSASLSPQVQAASNAAAAAGGGQTPPPSSNSSPSYSVAENEKRLLREALIKARGNRTKAAELMGISRRTLHRKLAEWPELDTID